MRPGDPVRDVGVGGEVHRVSRVTGAARNLVAIVCEDGWRKSPFVESGRAATHRKDGTAYPLCEVCWPDGEVAIEE